MEVPQAPPIKTFYTEVPIATAGAPNCIIAVPAGEDYAAMGREVAAAIKDVSGAEVPVQEAAGLSRATLENSNVILLGYFANNPLVNVIYDLHYVCLDAEWPGAGGYVVRTVHDPLGTGTSCVYLGGSDAESTGLAVDYFIASLPENGDIAYPHTVRIMLPNGLAPYKPNPEAVQKRIDAARSLNFRAAGDALTVAATNYYTTGNPEELEVFKGLVPIFHAIIAKMGQITDSRGTFYLFNMWDNAEESPVFSPEDRQTVHEMLWEFANKFAPTLGEAHEMKVPAGNHWDARVAYDVARYFYKYYNIDAGGLWTWAGIYFTEKAKFWRSAEDCPGYGGMTVYDTMYYCIPEDYTEFFDGGNARKMADYGMAVMNNLGGHAGFGDTSSMGAIGYWSSLFQACAWKYQDGRYLHAYEKASGLTRSNFAYNTYLQNEIKPEVPTDMLGVHVVPLPDWVYENRGDVLGTAPVAMNPVLDADPTPPREECFDKITFRASFERDDQYMILGGISHGYHAHPDGNSIIEMTDEGRYCIFDSGYFVPDTVEHNTLVVYRDGLFEPIPRLTGLSAIGDFPKTGMTQTYLNGYNGVNWRRNIIWNKENYFLVIDEVEAEEDANFGMNLILRTLSDKAPQIGADRVMATYQAKPFRIVSASHTPFKTTGTMPPNAERHAVIEAKAVDMEIGEKEYFFNLLDCGGTDEEWPYEIVPAGAGAVMVKSADGYALAGTGKYEAAGGVVVDAAVFNIRPDGFEVAGGRTFTAGQTWFASDVPISIGLQLGTNATGTIEAKQPAIVTLWAADDTVDIDGKTVKARTSPDGVEIDIAPGQHTIAFKPGAAQIAAGAWEDAYAEFAGEHKAVLAQMAAAGLEGETMEADWELDVSRTEVRSVYENADGEEVVALSTTGTPKVWADAQSGCRPRDSFDGNPETYSATGSGLAWTNDAPKDMGMEWPKPVKIGVFEIDYYSAQYAPADDGHELQAWDAEAEDWYKVLADVTKDDSGTNWRYTFPPVETTRMRVLITKFNPSRTAVREVRIFAEDATHVEREVRIPLKTNALAGMDVDGDGQVEILAAIGNIVRCIKADSTVIWEQELPNEALAIDAYDLDNDGYGEVVAGCRDHKLYCFDYQGNERWAVLTPADPYLPEVEPATGEVKVVGCADIDGDGDGEIVIGSSNWFAYGYDHEGNKLWGVLNWAHQPTSIAFVDLGNGTLGSFISTTYNDANLFGPDGKKIGGVSVGYHGAAMSTASGDLDDDGHADLITGSRVGGVHCAGFGSTRSWTQFMGAEVTAVAVADMNNDEMLEVIATSKNFHVLVTDPDGTVLWSKNVGEAILDMAVADINGDAIPEIIVATEGGMVRVLDSNGTITHTFAAPDDVTKIVVGDFNGDGQMQIAAGCSDGVLYGDLR